LAGEGVGGHGDADPETVIHSTVDCDGLGGRDGISTMVAALEEKSLRRESVWGAALEIM
jgi:hypothetical protein